MKRRSNLYNNITFEDFIEIYGKQIRVNTKNKLKIKKFEDFYSMNISNAYRLFKTKTYDVGKYNIFLIREPKYRIIMSQNILDKLVNHVVAGRILLPVLDKSLINTNVATRTGKGTHYGIRYLKKYLRSYNGEVYALKFDISKYFYTIDHELLMDMLREKIKDKDALEIIQRIINSTDKKYVNDTIARIKNQELQRVKELDIDQRYRLSLIGEIERIPFYEKGKGLPIGNMTSQIMAIFYLNKLDHYIKEKLHIKHYIRYMDDGVLLSSDKEYLKYCLKMIEREVSKYKLKLNRKTRILNVSKEGLDFLGFRFYIKNKIVMKVRKDCKKRFRRKMKRIKEGKYDADKALSVIKSYEGHFKWGNCYRLYCKYFVNYEKL